MPGKEVFQLGCLLPMYVRGVQECTALAALIAQYLPMGRII